MRECHYNDSRILAIFKQIRCVKVVVQRSTLHGCGVGGERESTVGYSPERIGAVLTKMGPPHNRSIPILVCEEGVSTGMLYSWCTKARATGRLMPDNDHTPEGWTSCGKFSAVPESAAMGQAELGEYCRRRAILPEQLAAW